MIIAMDTSHSRRNIKKVTCTFKCVCDIRIEFWQIMKANLTGIHLQPSLPRKIPSQPNCMNNINTYREREIDR